MTYTNRYSLLFRPISACSCSWFVQRLCCSIGFVTLRLRGLNRFARAGQIPSRENILLKIAIGQRRFKAQPHAENLRGQNHVDGSRNSRGVVRLSGYVSRYRQTDRQGVLAVLYSTKNCSPRLLSPLTTRYLNGLQIHQSTPQTLLCLYIIHLIASRCQQSFFAVN